MAERTTEVPESELEEQDTSETQSTEDVQDDSDKTNLAENLRRLQMTAGKQNHNFPQRKERKKTYAFWGKQPVPQFEDVGKFTNVEEGPIDVPKTLDDIRKEPIRLLTGFEWCECDVRDPTAAEEVRLCVRSGCHVCVQVYKLLTFNYVEDDDMMFRFDYSAAFLQWALLPPGYRAEWLLGVRVSASKRLVGFISAIPADVHVNGTLIKMVEINFLCVHKKIRAKRLAPVLIKEITRRVNLQDIWQATYTAGAVLPTPIAQCRYWHRSLNPKKLIDVGFSRLGNHMTMAGTIRLYRLPDEPKTPGFRRLKEEDCPKVRELLQNYLSRFSIAVQFSLEEIRHWLIPREGVVYAYVVESPSGEITDFTSFYSLPSTILGQTGHSSLNAAFMYYTVPGSASLYDLMKDALIMAKVNGFDVFNALDILENETILKDLKFGEGDGLLQYYLYNWRTANYLRPHDVGLILL